MAKLYMWLKPEMQLTIRQAHMAQKQDTHQHMSDAYSACVQVLLLFQNRQPGGIPP